ncbi:FKBP-type peptidyl-prolyl cis-trans isomerase [Enterobacteriaceae endosymbiont of Donacia cincticornis]|uniref:FKBP-type peptidyl-prolyl cis-trans isomerase n=1 Tax=Enterobacteriaceae endosymbiont of Donacia cincticornis TaxID=2675773 RepID=UPI001448BB59|nr:FKBP-type peptidyl-prolyl cis-trans isomerase [Enterobacteriaceae endosymbiont of Donacia cincticornis]QJC36206.1 FKBP-type peptidyl-prolyl cis-trans isomerase [Enterobacteriaceae endosymbiont of Donacia cincticornis]
MKFFTKKNSIFIILILSIGLNISNTNAFTLKNVSWWPNKEKTKNVTKQKTIIHKKKHGVKNKKQKEFFKNDNDKIAYSLGITIGKYLTRTFQVQKTLKMVLNRKFILQGVSDALDKKYKLSNNEIDRVLQLYDANVKAFSPNEIQEEIKNNGNIGKKYIQKILKEKGFKKTSTGLVYKIHKIGKGKKITNNNQIIVIKYTGKLIDGTKFDSTEKNKPLFICLKQVIAGWQEGLKYIKKGGKITLIIPPKLAYGSEIISGIPSNSTLRFEIELLDIKNSVSN